MPDSYPRRKARTRNFTLGAPRSFRCARDGSRVVFLRSPAGDDPRTALWVYDGEERLVAEAPAPRDLTAEELARRERLRESAAGITSFAIDDAARVAAFAVGGALYRADIDTGAVEAVETPGAAFDPSPDPAGERIAFVADGALHVTGIGRLTPDDGATWGLAEFIAEEELGRHYGYRWAPDGRALLVARVDETPVAQWWIADAADPSQPARAVRYPAAGQANADVSLHIVGLDGSVTPVAQAEPYVASFRWDAHGPLASFLSRDQTRLVTVAADTGAVLAEQTDDAWVDLTPGVPARLPDGRLLTVDHEVLKADGRPVAEHVRAVDGDVIVVSPDPTATVVRTLDGETLADAPGVHAYVDGVVGSRNLDHHAARWTYRGHTFVSHADAPDVLPRPRLLTVGERDLRVAVVLPREHDGSRLPVLLHPYGGPHHARVVRSAAAYGDDQWLADQGFAVLIADNRGTPGRGRDFTVAVDGDLATAPLEDQVDALHATAEIVGELDLERVGIMGWSFGGWLAAVAVLRRPDVFHAAVAGAPVTDWSLYDTAYTERYLDAPFASLVDEAPKLERPLMIIHGLADDNVVAAHSLRLSAALTAAGRRHTFLPLPGITHMTPREDVAENLLLLQADFLRRSLAARPDPGRSGT